MKKIYQIEIIDEDGEMTIPEGLFSFQVFATREAARRYADDNNIGIGIIREYDESDIEDYTIIDY